jgi:hypothetical protein
VLKPKAKVVVGIVVFIGASLVYYFGTHAGFPPSFSEEPHRASGVIMAQEALKFLRTGGKLYVVARDTTNFKCPAADYQLEGFKKAVADAHAGIDSVESIPVDPLRPLQAPPGNYFDLMRKAPKGSVIVSFMGPPVLSDEQWDKLGELKVVNVVFCPGATPAQSELRSLFDRQVVQLAVIDRSLRPEVGVVRGSEKAIFDENYILVTAGNSGVVPVSAPAKHL